MPFTLRVEFTGLCMYVVPAAPPANPEDAVNTSHVTIFLPDCRRGKVSSEHEDTSRGTPHVGYLRFDLANVASLSTLTPGPADRAPNYEGVYRFTGQHLDFGLSNPALISAAPNMPEAGRLSQMLQSREELRDMRAAGYAVMRTKLTGGTLRGTPEDSWEFINRFKDQPVYTGTFADRVIWTRKVTDADTLTLTLTNFRSGATTTLPLVPVMIDGEATISLKIANLCCENPLEWKDLDDRSRVTTMEDHDFKWFYRLLLPAGKPNYYELRDGKPFPIPREWGADRGGQGCIGLTAFEPQAGG